MLTAFDKIVNVKPGHITPCGHEYIFFDETAEVKFGDIVTVGYSHNPGQITSTLPSNIRGFIIQGYAGHSMGFMRDLLSKKTPDGAIAFWRKAAKFKREYVPSEWARPVPLP